MITAVLVDVIEGFCEPVKIEPTLKEYYKLLSCDTIDITYRQIGTKAYDIICDDNGLATQHPKISAVDSQGEPCLVGNLLVVNYDGSGGEATLEDSDVEHILKHRLMITTAHYTEPYYILAGVDFPKD